MLLKDVISAIESFAPSSYQESYDNTGLIFGNPNTEIDGVLISLDITEDLIQEAIDKGLNLIVSHHPPIFQPIKKLTYKNFVERTMIKAVQHEINIYCAHTNLDNIKTGVNARIAEKIGLTNTKILLPLKGQLCKLVTFAPEDHAEAVRHAIFEAGAGFIGEYDQCSFNSQGFGTFRGSENSNPFAGEKGKMSIEKEIRIETIFPVHLKNAILASMIKVHPYEEVAYDIYPLENEYNKIGAGLLGELKNAEDEMEFLKKIKTNFACGIIKHSKLLNKKINKVAVCGGSGSFLISNAISSGADIFVTGEIKYHQFFETEGKILLADIGHFESEQYTKEIFYELLIKKFPKFAVHFSEINTNPINYL